MISTDGRIFHNMNLIHVFGINSNSMETYLVCDVEAKTLSLYCNNKFNSFYLKEMPNEVYFIVSCSK